MSYQVFKVYKKREIFKNEKISLCFSKELSFGSKFISIQYKICIGILR
jgi:hypothetical protein